KLEGVSGLIGPKEDVGRNEMRVIARRARNFVLGEGTDWEENGRLFFREKDGRLATCVLEDQVEKVLMEAHDAHGHFAHGITAGRLHGNRSEEHTSELSHSQISYAVFCLKKKKWRQLGSG